MKIIVLGVGNPILRDDGVGIHVIQQLKQQVNDPDVTVDEALTGGMNLLDLILGYDKAILIDAIRIKNGETGEVKRFSLNDFSSVHSCNPHDVSFKEAVQLAEKMGEKRIPDEIVVIGVVVNNMPYIFGDQLSPRVAEAVSKAVEMTLSELRKWGEKT
ncbi:MAG: hydrogenase maturation protease [Thermoplasmatales archaeon]|nr:hydrogenase maturation protease [Thermoplasmatales archaeon]